MSINLIRLPEYGLNLNLYSGSISPVELFRHLRRLDSTANWLSYFDSTADLSRLDLADFPKLKRAVTAKEHERDGDEPKLHALVNVPAANAIFVRFWCRYAPSGVPIAHRRAIFPTLDRACHWLALPPDAQPALAKIIATAEASTAQAASAATGRSADHSAAPQSRAARP